MKKALVFFAVIFSLSTVDGQTDQEKVIETTKKNDIEAHIHFLSDDLLKGRETGTPENKIAASYLANTLRSYGVKQNPKSDNYYQEFQLKKVSKPSTLFLSINGKEYKQKVAMQSANVDFEGGLVYLGYGLEEDYKGVNVNEKFVLLKSGGPNSKDARDAFDLISRKSELAKKAGALGVIELLDAQTQIWSYIEHDRNSDRLTLVTENDNTADEKAFAYVWLLDPNREYTSTIEGKKGHKVSITIKGDFSKNITTQNVIGMVEGTDPVLKNEYIIYSAHYDHVGIGTPDKTGDTIYNGARDNAVGTTTVLSMAKNLAAHPTKRSALFILFTGEEKGLLGSEYYVENPVLPLKQMVYCFNSDNGGYNDTSLATIVGLNRTTASHHIIDGAAAFGLKAIDDPAPEQGLFDRSDNVHFAKKGIPAPTYSMGFTAFNGDVTKYYHRPGDESDSLDFDYLLKFFRSYVMTGRLIGNDPKTPVWTSGDKYEAQSKKLYND
tara:strand:+ start:34085 stop:35566 length:1482 start_codon:yes stop_codon:yes gene_type:complete